MNVEAGFSLPIWLFVLAAGVLVAALVVGVVIVALLVAGSSGRPPKLPRVLPLTPSAKRLIANVVSIGAVLVWGAALISCMANYGNGPWPPAAQMGVIFGTGVMIALQLVVSRWAYPRRWQERRKRLGLDLDPIEPTPLPVAKPVAARRSPRIARREPAGIGYSFVASAWVVAGFAVVIFLVMFLATTRHRPMSVRWADDLSAGSVIFVGLIVCPLALLTFARLLWINRNQPAASVQYAHETAPRPAEPVPVPVAVQPEAVVTLAPAPPRACPKCAAPIAAGSPEGLCPRCLLQQVLPSEPRLSPTTGYAPFLPPTVAEVAEFFPQLEILGLIGQGGMGAVYLARQRALDRTVALKLIRVRDDDPTFAERFAREAKAMARLSHPNIVAVHESGEAGGLPYLVMEYVDGVTLRDAMRAKQLSPAEALAVIPQICDALEYAHRQGVVHRDVKPENILLDRAGKVKIADFGLAKLADPDGLSLTGTQQAMGTPHYMAPEQWERPGEVDHRADIYALGVVLYELLTGELPLGRFDPPSSKVQIDVRIDEVVLRALAKEPVRRYQHASEVKTALEHLHATTGWVRTPTFREYKSKRTLLGWPLVHVVSGRDSRTGRAKTAKGWIAVGDESAVGGIAVAGGSAVGAVAVSGGISVGLFALAGGMALGGITVAGGMAAGALLSVAGGMSASFGFALAGGMAAGRFALAGGHGAGSNVLASNRHDADFGEQLSEWIEDIWDDYLWPF
jgi:predicted Ser/Thr protein kinase